VIHTVGPVYRDGRHGEPGLLASCYRESLKLAEAHGCASVAFPAISCGVYGYPIADACAIAVREVAGFLDDARIVRAVTFACFGPGACEAYRRALAGAGIRTRGHDV
jgi:O-acetyl-ADP-ribose deacetylase (regulator of RNase III)